MKIKLTKLLDGVCSSGIDCKLYCDKVALYVLLSLQILIFVIFCRSFVISFVDALPHGTWCHEEKLAKGTY